MTKLQKLLSRVALISSAYFGFVNKSFSQETTTTLETILAKPHVKEILSNQTYVPKMNGRVIYVDDDNTTGSGTLEDPYNKIQRAIDNANNGDEIIVAQGRYVENVLIDGKGIKIKSVNPLDENIIKSTIIDGQTSDTVLKLRDNSSTTTLEGLTITNGKAQYGGGINAKNSLLSLDNCVVTNNSCFGERYYTQARGGGGVYCENTTTTIRNCTISDNDGVGESGVTGRFGDGRIGLSVYGGGLYFLNSKARIDDCIIASNTNASGSILLGGLIHAIHGYSLPSRGGGIYAKDSSMIVKDSIIDMNLSKGGNVNGTGAPMSIEQGGDSFGGGVYCETTSASLFNCILSKNSSIGGSIDTTDENPAKQHGGAYGGGVYNSLDSTVTLANCTIADNSVQRGSGPGTKDEKGSGIYGDYATMKNTILWNNRVNQIDGTTTSTQPIYSDIQDWIQGGTGNISLDPQFIEPANGDFHLRSTSPCIDAGMRIENLLTDIEGNPRGIVGTTEPRGDGSHYDIGAYEYNPSKSVVDRRAWSMYE